MIFWDRMSLLLVLMLGRGVALSDLAVEESAIVDAPDEVRARVVCSSHDLVEVVGGRER